tara:strand:- start:300 stop:854 length:555 start_codon:yes stop_codon:yes gene_type:complete
MIFYQAKNAGLRVHKFCKSIEEARAVIKEHSPNAKKIAGQEFPEMMFEEGWTLEKSELDQTKDGILRALNTHAYALADSVGWIGDRNVVVVNEGNPTLEVDYDNARFDRDRLSAKVAEQERYIERLEKADLEVRKAQQNLATVSPCIQYDNFPAEKTGKCLHCQKTVGYVGGMPRVNPPASIRD